MKSFFIIRLTFFHVLLGGVANAQGMNDSRLHHASPRGTCFLLGSDFKTSTSHEQGPVLQQPGHVLQDGIQQFAEVSSFLLGSTAINFVDRVARTYDIYHLF